MPIVLNGTTGITTPTYNGNTTAEYLVPVTAFKNRIINGAMVINQRYGTTSQTNVNGFVTDRFQVLNSSAGTVNAQTVTTAPAGFTYSTRLTVGTADASVGAADSVIFYQTLEGYNIADLNWGTANAKVATLSFWVYSSLTGNYSGSLVDQAGNYSYPFNYTISSANTWEQKSITIAAPTGGGTFGTTNDVGVYLEFSLMTGTTYQGTANAWSAGNFRGTSSQVNWMATSGNTWFITGVQLEVGSTATSFDYRPYGTELALCQRYFQKLSNAGGSALYVCYGSGHAIGTASANTYLKYANTMRSQPALSYSGAIAYSYGGGAAINLTGVGSVYAGSDSVLWQPTTSTVLTAGQATTIIANNDANAFITLSAEL